MNEKEKQAAKVRRRRLLLMALDVLLVFGAIVLIGLGRRHDNNILLFAGMLVLFGSWLGFPFALRQLNRQSEQEIELLHAEEAADAEAEIDLLQEPGAAPPDLIVMGYPSDTTYQVLAGEQELHFVRLGWGEWLSVKALDRMLEPGMTGAEIRAGMEKGFSVPWREIESVDVTFKHCVSTQLENFGIFALHSGGKRRRFILLSRDAALDTPERIRSFFTPVSGKYAADTARYDKRQDELREDMERETFSPDMPADPALAKKLRPLGFALAAAALLAGLVWRFLDVPYDLFAWIVTGLTLLPMVLVAVWPRVFSLASLLELQRGDRADKIAPNTVDLSYALFAGGIMTMLGALADFNIENWPWLIGVTLVFACGMTLLMTRTITIRKLWLRRALMAIVIAMFCMGAVLELNYLLDYREPTVDEAVITDMQISGGRSTTYDLYFDGGRSYSVAKADYEAFETGDTVVLVERAGALGVRYVEVWTTESWYGE